jgi:hypothetical protein
VSDLLAWCFHSPRRLLLVGVALVAVLILVGAGVRELSPGASRPSPSTSAAASVPVRNAGPAVQAAVAFTKAWASKPESQSAEEWQGTLEPLVTPELGRLLATTDPAQLPGGAPTDGASVRFVSASSALVEVPLTTGKGVLVTVVLLNGRWLAQDVEPVAGDVGAG